MRDGIKRRPPVGAVTQSITHVCCNHIVYLWKYILCLPLITLTYITSCYSHWPSGWTGESPFNASSCSPTQQHLSFPLLYPPQTHRRRTPLNPPFPATVGRGSGDVGHIRSRRSGGYSQVLGNEQHNSTLGYQINVPGRLLISKNFHTGRSYSIQDVY